MHSEPPPPPVAPGQVIAGRYLVGDVLGRGGAGVVCAATHVGLDAPVAIKFLAPSLMEHDARRRFVREARLTHRLRSPHAVRILDVGTLDDGALYLVMERLQGFGLEVELARRAVLPEREAAHWAAQAAEALADAHALGIVHRDVKPTNLFLHTGPDGIRMLKLVDFGVSREMEGPGLPERTRTFMFVGTPRYMAPEQWTAGVPADPSMDVYSLGVVLHEMVTGCVPFEDMPPQARAAAVLEGRVADPRSLVPEIDARLAELVVACTRPDPAARPTAQALIAPLVALAEGRAGRGDTLAVPRAALPRSLPPPEARAASPTAGPPTMASEEAPSVRSPRSPVHALAVGVLLALLVAVVVASVVLLLELAGVWRLSRRAAPRAYQLVPASSVQPTCTGCAALKLV